MKNMIIGLSVKAITALENGKNWAQSGKMTHRKAFIVGMLGAIGTIGEDAFAQATTGVTTNDPLKNVSIAMCTVTKALQGPIGIAIILALVVVAGLSLATGGKNSTSLLISALIGGAVVFGAKALLGLVVGTGAAGNTCQTGTVG
jgi:type IV secretory pathway VirB2 component (pilin)